MTEDEAKKLILETLQGKSKSQVEVLSEGLLRDDSGHETREVKNMVNKMVQEGTLEYWSSGSTTLIGLKGMGKQHGEED